MDSSSSSGLHHQGNDDASHIFEGEDTLEKIVRCAVADCLNREWNCDIDVSINFQSDDTLANITGILHGSLLRQYVRAFINEGQDKIERSLISIVVFSKNYASTKSCMLELDKILECRKKYGQIVIPIFYGLKPSDVRKLSEILADTFVKELQDLKSDPKEIVAKAEKWKACFTTASHLSGWVSMNFRSDEKLVEQIVKDILKKLNLVTSHNGERSAISECLLWQSPPPIPFTDRLSFSPGPATTINDSYSHSGRHNAQSLPLATSCKFSFDEAAAAAAAASEKHFLNLSRSSRTKGSAVSRLTG